MLAITSKIYKIVVILFKRHTIFITISLVEGDERIELPPKVFPLTLFRK